MIAVLQEGYPLEKWMYVAHEIMECPRCSKSTRPLCPRCNHSLSGRFNDLDGHYYSTTCEVCGAVWQTDEKP